MAYTERYVTSGAGGGGSGTEGDPWTLAEGFSSAVAGDRVNIQSDAGYNIPGGTVSNIGTVISKICFRGYNSAIGDLDNQGRDSAGSLIITNFPVITTSANITPATHSVFQNLNITGAIAGPVFGNQVVDDVTICSSRIDNTLNSGSAIAISMDDRWTLINCDVTCSAATHDIVVNGDNETFIYNCRFESTSGNSVILLSLRQAVVKGCAFLGGTSSRGLQLEFVTFPNYIDNCTFYGLNIAITLPNSAQGANQFFINNHYTDCNTGIDNLYEATEDKNIIEIKSRTRDNTNNRIGIAEEFIHFGDVTTDTGGPETDYVDAPNGDITLIPAAPAVDAGLGM